MAERVQVAAVECLSYDRNQVLTATRRAIELAGGLPSKLKPGAKVLVKPNLLTAKAPDAAATTHPEIVRALITVLREGGIEDIAVGDSPAGDHPWNKLWSETGFAEMAAETGVDLLPFDNFERVEIPGHGSVPVLRDWREFDAIISVPKLKTHLLTKTTGAVKNMYGLVIGNAKSSFHGLCPSPGAMAGFLVDLYGVLQADFALMDAVVCMQGDGPADGEPKDCGLIFASSDAVALDALSAGIYGYAGKDIPLLAGCAAKGYGVAAAAGIAVAGDGAGRLRSARARKSRAGLINSIPRCLFRPLSYLLTCRPRIDTALCRACGLCEKVCPRSAIQRRGRGLRIIKSRCVLCMCCLEACPHQAVELMSPGLRLRSWWRRLNGGEK